MSRRSPAAVPLHRGGETLGEAPGDRLPGVLGENHARHQASAQLGLFACWMEDYDTARRELMKVVMHQDAAGQCVFQTAIDIPAADRDVALKTMARAGALYDIDDPDARVACETATTTGLVLVLGEITTSTYIDFQQGPVWAINTRAEGQKPSETHQGHWVWSVFYIRVGD